MRVHSRTGSLRIRWESSQGGPWERQTQSFTRRKLGLIVTREKWDFPFPDGIRKALQQMPTNLCQAGVQWPAAKFSGSKLKVPYSHTHSADHRNHKSTSTRPIPPDPSRPYLSQTEATSVRLPLSKAAKCHQSIKNSGRPTTDLYPSPPRAWELTPPT